MATKKKISIISIPIVGSKSAYEPLTIEDYAAAKLAGAIAKEYDSLNFHNNL